MDRSLANSSTIGSTATILASLVTLGFTASGFIESVTHQQDKITLSGQNFGGYAIMGWLGVLFLVFGWAGAAYSV
jgi:adenylosuccinate lyase